MPGNASSPDAHPMSTVPPRVLDTANLDAIAVNMSALLRLMREQIPKGRTPFLQLDVTTTRSLVKLAPPAWFSIDIFNDGASDLEVHVNDPSRDPIIVRPGEDHRFDFQAPVIEQLFLGFVSGSGSVRLEGTY